MTRAGQTAETEARHPLGRAGRVALAGASAPQVGLMLLGLTAAHLAVVSVVEEPLARWLDVPPQGVYAWWPLPTLAVATCLVMLLSTVVRLPLRAAHLGTWAAHLGVVAIAGGGLWYAAAGVAGQAATVRTTDGYRPLRHVSLSDTAAVYVADAPAGPWRQHRLRGVCPERAGDEPGRMRPLDIPLPPDEPALRVTGLQAGPLRSEMPGGGWRTFPAAAHVEVGRAGTVARVPFAPFAAYAPTVPVDVGKRRMYLRFARARRALPQEVGVAGPEYLTLPHSAMPRDYRCVLTAAGRERTLTLHDAVRVGPWRLTHAQWLPDGPLPQRMIFDVRTRPGVWLVWCGCAVVAVALPYAFFVKPLLVGRRERRR
ncbi:MAG: hypothetical protein KGY99_08280 [Phycisphaerae bacterium]|nr:hypothetical protein [Phycisphaerae bacterium]